MDKTLVRKLKSSDGKIIELDSKYFTQSKFLSDFIKDFPEQKDEIVLGEIDSKTLSKITEYLIHFEKEQPKEISMPLPSPDLKPILSEWEYNYITPIPLIDLPDLVNGANFLEIKSLVDLVSARFASELTNVPLEEARTKFGVDCDMTEKEKKEIDKFPI